MDCEQPGLPTGQSFFERIGLNQRRIPIAGSIELTFRCNLRCVHCYLGERRGNPPAGAEMSTAEICAILDQLAQAGTLWLLLTGGEPLLRPDFKEIYAYARQKGFLVSLFTNGTLLTEQLADFLADLPPYNTEISLYGATQATYERVTGIPGSFARCLRAVELLRERGIALKLKAMAMTLTAAEIPAMRDFAGRLGLEFRFDPILSDDLDRRGAPLGQRLSAQEVARLEQSDPRRLEEWRRFYQQQMQRTPHQDYLYTCGAGVSTYHIDPAGRMSVCMSARAQAYDLRQGSFQEGWEVFLRGVRATPAPAESNCSRCRLHPLCGIYPAWAESEGSQAGQPVEYLCQIGRQRAAAFNLPGQDSPGLF